MNAQFHTNKKGKNPKHVQRCILKELSLPVQAGCSALAPLPSWHCLQSLCLGHALHQGPSPSILVWALLLHH